MGKDTIILLVKIFDHTYQGSSCMIYDGTPVVEAYRHVFALRMYVDSLPSTVRRRSGTALTPGRFFTEASDSFDMRKSTPSESEIIKGQISASIGCLKRSLGLRLFSSGPLIFVQVKLHSPSDHFPN